MIAPAAFVAVVNGRASSARRDRLQRTAVSLAMGTMLAAAVVLAVRYGASIPQELVSTCFQRMSEDNDGVAI